MPKTETKQSEMKRPPVVVVMGHVDHGKTTLLDYIRKTSLADREAGGITQGVGAYEITHNNERITFIDTPGHEAFAKMRSRGASIADIAILVVAADDGVKPQTKEVIDLLQESKLPYVVAINKIDKPNADLEKTKLSLSQNSVLLEGFGGNISFQAISAKTGQGVEDLLDLILLLAEVENFTCDTSLPASGFVLEAKRDAREGVTATLIIKNGTLKFGDEVFTTSTSGKIKGLKDFLKKGVKSLTPSSPALVTGFADLPKTGEAFLVGEKPQSKAMAEAPEQEAETRKKRVSFVIKAAVAGSVEALADAISKLPPPDEDTAIVIADTGVGDISDGDVKHAITTNSYLVGLDVKVTPPAQSLLTGNESVKLFQSNIIYEVLDQIAAEFKSTKKGIIAGDLEILAAFNTENLAAQIIGGRVVAGTIKNRATLEIHRKNKEIGTGTITNLQCNKEDSPEVLQENECGLLFKSDIAIEKGDHLVMRPE